MVITEEPTHALGGNRERFDMDVKEIRRRNLMYLLFTAKDRDGMSSKDFAAKCDTAPATISQITSTTQKIKKSMGDTLARRIEQRMNLPHGWMDVPNWAPDPSMLDLFKDLQDAINPEDIDTLHEEPKQRYVTAFMHGSSMESSNPKKSIPDGARLTVRTVFDEARISGKVVLVELENSKNQTIKEIQVDGDIKYLIPWNERYEVIKLTGKYKIIGYVTEVTISLSR